MKKIYIFLFIIVIITGCTLNNTSRLNVIKSITDLPKGVEKEKKINIQTVYKLKNGIIAVRYKKYYGYWYRIRRGESLYSIARRNGFSVKYLRRANNLPSKYRLKYKAYLFIPIPNRTLKKRATAVEIPITEKEFIWPIYGRISSGFGLRKWGWRKKFHKGIDIAAPVGTKVMASKSGKIIFANRKKAYGNVIIIKHSDVLETRYAHLNKILVKRGDTVKQGQIIGFVGKTGRATGYHLHFEIRVLNTPVNPINYLPQQVNELAKIYYKERIKSLGLRQ